MYEPFTTFDGFVISGTSQFPRYSRSGGSTIKNCMIHPALSTENPQTGSEYDQSYVKVPTIIENNVVVGPNASITLGKGKTNFRCNNNTVLGSVGDSLIIGAGGPFEFFTGEINNNLVQGRMQEYMPAIISGAGNIFGAGPQYDYIEFLGNFTTDTSATSTGTTVIYDASTYGLVNVDNNDALAVGTTSSNIPTTDIEGNTRIRHYVAGGVSYADPGAKTLPPLSITKTIGLGGSANGFDFSDPQEAEGSLIATCDEMLNNSGGTPGADDRNLAKRNANIVHEANAGVYTIGSNLIFSNGNIRQGPGNQVSYKAASGSEHNGDINQGVRIRMPLTQIYDDFLEIDGLVFVTSVDNVNLRTIYNRAASNKVSNCIISHITSNATLVIGDDSSAAERSSAQYPTTYKNNVLYVSGLDPQEANTFSFTHGGRWNLVNNTIPKLVFNANHKTDLSATNNV
jgi:hypothetical protein